MRYLLVVTLFFLSLPLLAQTTNTSDEIIAQETAFWKAYVDGNVGDLSTLLLPDFVNLWKVDAAASGEAQIWSRDQVLTFVKQFHQECSLAPVKLVDPQVTFLTPGIAALVYHATETPTCGNRTPSGETNISSVWLRRDGRWQMHLQKEYAVLPQ